MHTHTYTYTHTLTLSVAEDPKAHGRIEGIHKKRPLLSVYLLAVKGTRSPYKVHHTELTHTHALSLSLSLYVARGVYRIISFSGVGRICRLPSARANMRTSEYCDSLFTAATTATWSSRSSGASALEVTP
jgi:hypothetical protein